MPLHFYWGEVAVPLRTTVPHKSPSWRSISVKHLKQGSVLVVRESDEGRPRDKVSTDMRPRLI